MKQGQATFVELPPELIELIVEGLPQEGRRSLCLVSRQLRQNTEPFLYRDVRIRHVRASKSFHQRILQDDECARWVKRIAFEYESEEDRTGCPDDEETASFLPNLESLAFYSPYHDSSTWERILPRALDPASTSPVFRCLKACRLAFWDGNGEFWHCDQSLGVIYLPTLESLELENFGWDGGGLPAAPCPIATPLRPLLSFSLLECDVHESALSDFFTIRQTHIFSMTKFKEDYPPIEYGLSRLPAYAPALACGSETLEALRIKRYFDQQDDPVPFRALTSLRILNMDPSVLLGAEGSADRAGQEWLEGVLPPNIILLQFDCSDDTELTDEVVRLLETVMGAKSALMPKLRRIELAGVINEQRNISRKLQEAIDAADVEVVFVEGYGSHEEWIGAMKVSFTIRNMTIRLIESRAE